MGAGRVHLRGGTQGAEFPTAASRSGVSAESAQVTERASLVVHCVGECARTRGRPKVAPVTGNGARGGISSPRCAKAGPVA